MWPKLKPWTSRTTVAYVEWVIEHRWLVVVGVLLAATLAMSGVRFLTFSTNYRIFFTEDNPQRRAFDAVQAIYTRNDNVLFTLRPRGGDVFTPAVLGAIRDLTERAWQVPYSIRVDSITNFQHTHAAGDDLTVEDLVPNPGRLSSTDLARIRSVALSEPLLANRLISRDASTTGVNVTVHMPQKDERETGEVMAYARRLAEETRTKHPDITVAVTGIVALSNAFVEASVYDITTLAPLMYGIIIVVMLGLLRSVNATCAAVVLVGLATGTGMGLAGWLGIPLSSPAVNAPTIIVTLAVADSVHILISMFEGMRSGLDKRAALIESARINLQPVFLTSLTTIIGFLSLNFSDAPPFRDLGNITAIGIAAAWLYSVLFLPPMIAILPIRVRPGVLSGRVRMERLANFVVARRRGLLWGTIAVAGVLGACIPRIEVNEQFVSYFDERVRFRRDTDFTTRYLTGIYQLHYSLGAGDSGAIHEPAYFARVDDFARWLWQQPGVVHVSTITDVMKRLNKNMHGDDPGWYRLPDTRELAAQYLLLYEMSLPYGLDLNNQINVDKSATRLSVTVESLSTREFRDLKERADAWLVQHMPPSMQGEGTGTTVIFTYLNFRNIRGMLQGTVVALLLICLCLCVALRSLKLGLLSMVPNLIPPLLGFGIWALVVGEIGLAASFCTAVALGIIVDDTVHLMSKYLRARREQGLTAPDAVRYAFATVGAALCVTSGILVAGFGVLAYSAFVMNQTLGMLTAIMIVAALGVDFFLFAPLLMALDRRTPR